MIGKGALASRASAVIAMTVGLAVLLSVILAGLKFERSLYDVTVSRVSVIVDDLRQKVELGLTLGLDLAELVDVQALVERGAASAPEIRAIQVVDPDGIVLFASDRAAIGWPMLDRWPEGTALPAEGVRQHSDGKVLTIGTGLRNSFGQTVGEVVLRYSLTSLISDMTAARAVIHTETLALVALAALGTLAGAALMIRAAFRAPSATADGARTQAEDDLADLEADLDIAFGPSPATDA